MIGFAANRLMQLEADTLFGAAPGERTPERLNQRNGHRNRDWQTRAGNVELCASPSCGMAVTSQRSWSRAGWQRRR